jgi:hypothetical protein
MWTDEGAVTGLGGNIGVSRTTSDGLELVLEDTGAFYVVRRATTQDAWGGQQPLGLGGTDPTIDGRFLAIVYADVSSATPLMGALRATSTEPFGAPFPIAGTQPGDTSPWMSNDGRMLLFSRAGTLYSATAM